MFATNAELDFRSRLAPFLDCDLPGFVYGTNGIIKTTIWRFRKRGMLNTINIYGRQYISRAEIARFNARATAEEFARIGDVPDHILQIISA